jgi:hypothetical protein
VVIVNGAEVKAIRHEYGWARTCPAGRTHYAWSGQFVTRTGLRMGAPVGRK